MKHGLVGRILGHSFSPMLHKLLWDADYALFPMQETELKAFFEKRDFAGVNVTIPYKQAVIPYLDRMDEKARRIGCVNTVVKEKDGSLSGYNTDYDGFAKMAARAGIDFAGKKVLIFGTGATSMTVSAVARDAGCREVIFVSRTGSVNYQNVYEQTDAQILVNTTPVGMFPDNGHYVVNPADFPACEGVLDVVYNPLQTAFVRLAKRKGIPASGGLPMLVGQAAAAMPLFGVGECTDKAFENALSVLKRQEENIVLIGMPGSGKSTVGKLLAKELGRELVDTDEMVISRTDKSIPQIFAERGEAYFRRLEHDAIVEVGGKNGLIISIGGGGILKDSNREALLQNGRIYYLDRDANLLAREGRPLSKSSSALALMLETRGPIYESFCHKKIANNGKIEEAVEAILADFYSVRSEKSN